MSPWKTILATMVIFACGVVTGAMLTRTMLTRSEPALPANVSPGRVGAGPVLQMQRANFLIMLNRQLGLDAGQREQIAKILRSSQERTQPIWNQIAPQMNEELRSVREEIRGVLTPEQRAKFTEMLRRNRPPGNAQPGNARPPGSPQTPANKAGAP